MHRGICPVLTERVKEYTLSAGKPYTKKGEPHNFLRAQFTRGGSVSGHSEHPFEGNYALCRDCGEEDRDYHFCDHTVASSMGNWTRFDTCDRSAKFLEDEQVGLIGDEKKGRQYWHCKQHQVANVRARRVASDVRGRARFNAEMDKSRYGWLGHGYEELLVELSDWLIKNCDLVESDEWLKSIVRKMDKDEHLQDALEKAFGHRFIIPDAEAGK